MKLSIGIPKSMKVAAMIQPWEDPLGGSDVGYKGFGLSLLVEALTAAMTGFGRADAPRVSGAFGA